MSIINVLFCFLLLLAQETPAASPDFQQGLQALWNPLALIFFQALWLVLFLATGVSKVTGATISFHVRRERI